MHGSVESSIELDIASANRMQLSVEQDFENSSAVTSTTVNSIEIRGDLGDERTDRTGGDRVGNRNGNANGNVDECAMEMEMVIEVEIVQERGKRQ